MSVVLLFEPRLWEATPARHAAETVASLLEWRWRAAPLGAAVRDDEAIVFVGSGEAARGHDGLAAHVRVESWPSWSPAALAIGDFEGATLLAPGGHVTSPTAAHELPPEWLRSAGFMLAREEELLDDRRDQWECYSGAYTRLASLGALDRPLVNLQVRPLAERIEAWRARRGVTFERIPLWREGAPFAVALTHDVDDVSLHSLAAAWRLVRQARGPRSYAARAGVVRLFGALARLGQGSDPYWSFERWANEEERRGFRSTYYFFPPSPSRRHEYDATYTLTDRLRFDGAPTDVAGLMRTLAGRGHEIGLHGSYLSHRDGVELARQKRQLETATGQAVTGTRQHFLRFDPRVTWAAQEHAGFDYDATLGYNEAIGFRAGIAAPFHPFDPDTGTARRLLELPLTLMDGTLFRTFALSAAQAAERVRAHLDEVERAGGLGVLLWHPNAAAEQHFPGWWPAYLAALEDLSARGAWVAPAGTIAAWWRERAARQQLR